MSPKPRTATRLVVDTSVAVPLLCDALPVHDVVNRWAVGKTLVLAGHSLAETYSVTTRQPGDARLSPEDARTLIDASFDTVVVLSAQVSATVHHLLHEAGIAGGAVYDGLVALAAREAGLPLATRDARARATYEALGVAVEVVPSA